MKTFQIITDSSCDLPQELADKLELLVLPLHFTIGGKTYANYLDGREIGFHDFFERIRQGEAASTSAVNPESFREVMEQTLQQGLDILFVGFSSGLSTTYQSGCIAADDLREKYPEARMIYGGDLNTVDLNILFQYQGIELANTALKYYLSSQKIELDVCSLSDLPSLIQTINGILKKAKNDKVTYAPLPDDFVGSHAQLVAETGLTDARSHALETGIATAERDTWTTSDPGIPEFIKALNVPIVIDYAFFSSDNMTLTSYKVMTEGDEWGNTREAYMYVSDHFPVRTTYETPLSYE